MVFARWQALIFFATNHTGGDPKQNGIYFGSLDSPGIHFVAEAESAAQYASGYLLYRANAALVAQPFDPANGKLLGPATSLVNNLRDDIGVWRSIFSVSQNGALVYQVGDAASAKSHVEWISLAGRALADFDPDQNTVIDVRLSSDNKRVAFAGATGIWTYDLERKTKTRITFDPYVNGQPTWSADGKTLMFLASLTNGGGNGEIRSKAADGSGEEKTVITHQNNYHYPAWSPDGKYVTYLWGDGEKNVSLWIVPTSGDPNPVAIVQPPSSQSNLSSYRVSPDSRWVAYTSDESGSAEIYITSFPEGKGKWKVSAGSGAFPAWSGNGKEVFYETIGQDFYVCPITPEGAEIQVGAPQRLFNMQTPESAWGSTSPPTASACL